MLPLHCAGGVERWGVKRLADCLKKLLRCDTQVPDTCVEGCSGQIADCHVSIQPLSQPLNSVITGDGVDGGQHFQHTLCQSGFDPSIVSVV